MAIPNGLNPTIQNLNVYDGALQGGNAYSSSPILNVMAYTNCTTAGVRQGVANIGIYRSDVLATWDGNKDIAMKINAYNYAANGTNGGIECLEILARNSGTGATISIVKGLNVTAENKTGAGTVQTMTTAMFTLKNNGVCATSMYALELQDESQGTNPSATYLLRLSTSTINPASGALVAAINFAAKNTAGFTNAMYFESAVGLEGATYSGGSLSGTIVGKISVKIATNTVYIPVYTTLT